MMDQVQWWRFEFELVPQQGLARRVKAVVERATVFHDFDKFLFQQMCLHRLTVTKVRAKNGFPTLALRGEWLLYEFTFASSVHRDSGERSGSRTIPACHLRGRSTCPAATPVPPSSASPGAKPSTPWSDLRQDCKELPEGGGIKRTQCRIPPSFRDSGRFSFVSWQNSHLTCRNCLRVDLTLRLVLR